METNGFPFKWRLVKDISGIVEDIEGVLLASGDLPRTTPVPPGTIISTSLPWLTPRTHASIKAPRRCQIGGTHRPKMQRKERLLHQIVLFRVASRTVAGRSG